MMHKIQTLSRLAVPVAAVALLGACGPNGEKDANETDPAGSFGTVTQALVDLSTCSPKDLARNTTGAGTPSPLGSDPGVGDPWDLVDGATEYATEASGLEFAFGGTHQVTVDLGGDATLDQLTVWHHSDDGEAGHNIPNGVSLEYFDGSVWQPLTGFSRSYDLGYPQPGAGFGSYPDTYAFSPIVGSRVRWSFDGDGPNVLSPFGNPPRPGDPVLNDAVAVATGTYHTCAVRESGQVLCWGRGERGQLGNGSTDDEVEPQAVLGLDDAIAITAGADHTCALRSSNRVACWGAGQYGQLGNGETEDSSVPVPVTGLDDAVSLSAAYEGNCALRGTGQVVCWGSDLYGYLGNTGTGDESAPVAVEGLDVQALASGGFHACAVRTSGGVVCWGYNSSGQLGDGTTDDSSTPVSVIGVSGAVALGASGQHTCAVLGSGQMSCWGAGGSGQLGNGGTANSAMPVVVSSLSDAVAVDAGFDHTCALREGDTVSCWGGGELGQTGLGTTANTTTPVSVAGLTGVAEVSANTVHTCAMRQNGQLVCWGWDPYGQLGDGYVGIHSNPGPVVGLSDVVNLDAGLGHTCALRPSGEVWCWGLNSIGELGNGPSATVFSHAVSPGPVAGLSDAVVVASTGDSSCAARATGQVACWGYGADGQLGNGSTDSSPLPVPVTGIDDAISVAAGYHHGCALHDGGTVSCWGRGGMLGVGSSTDSSVPLDLSLTGVAQMNAGSLHTCAVLDTGQISCWGRASRGELGNGSNNTTFVPVMVSGIENATRVEAGDHTCAVLEGGSVQCWGVGENGELGNGGFERSYVPVPVMGLTNVVQVSPGFGHTCAVLESGSVKCWGNGRSGQLGNGSTAGSPTPVTVVGLSDAVRVTAGRDFSCALRETGEVVCWGLHTWGQLGNGVPTHSTTPVSVTGFGGTPWRAWPYEASVNGCPEPAVSELASGSGTVTTDSEGDGATLADPIETTVTSPSGGAVQISEAPAGTLSGFVLLGQQVDITTPASTIASPLQLAFVLDSSLLPEGVDENDVEVFKNEALVQACVAAPFAIPDPCVLSRTVENGDVVITVLTSSASIWTFGIAVQSDLDGDGVLDGYDLCSETPTGEIVDSDGCSIDQLCPCGGPRNSADTWKNHGQYVSCTSQAVNAFRTGGLISGSEGAAVKREAARSDCGRK